MIYLIGGASKSGKSYLSRKIMEEKKIPFFSTDFLLWSLGGENGKFSYFDSDEKVAPLLEDNILKIIFFLNKNNEDYVLEGTHITMSLYEKTKELYKDNVKGIFLGYTNITAEDKYEEVLSNEDIDSNKWYEYISKEDFILFLDKQIELSKKIKSIKPDLFFNVENIKSDYKKIINILFEM